MEKKRERKQMTVRDKKRSLIGTVIINDDDDWKRHSCWYHYYKLWWSGHHIYRRIFISFLKCFCLALESNNIYLGGIPFARPSISFFASIAGVRSSSVMFSFCTHWEFVSNPVKTKKISAKDRILCFDSFDLSTVTC